MVAGGDSGIAGAAELGAKLKWGDDASGGAGDEPSGEDGVCGVGVVGEQCLAHGAAVGGEAGAEAQGVGGGSAPVQPAEEDDVAVAQHSEVHGLA